MNQILTSISYPAGQRLEIVLGDLTLEPVEAIVNAANSHLLHGGGVAGVISRRGGPRIQQESIAWVRDHGPVSFDHPAYTSAGDLPYRCILHAVGPVWGEGDEDRKLALAVRSTLDLAVLLKISSISFPAISTGIFGFPVTRAAGVIVGAISAFFMDQPTAGLHLARIALLDRATAEPFIKAAETALTAGQARPA